MFRAFLLTTKTDWLKTIALPLGIVLMETCWVYPWAVLVGLWFQPDGTTPLASAPVIFCLLIVGQLSARAVLRRGWPLTYTRTGLVALGIVALLIAQRVDHYAQFALLDLRWLGALVWTVANSFDQFSIVVVALLLGAYLWWRGLSRGNGEVNFGTVEASFKLGLAALVVVLLAGPLMSATTYAQLQQHTGIYVVGYFLASLVSLSLARFQGVRTWSKSSTGGDLAFNRQWLVVVVGVVIVLLVLAVGIAGMVSFDLIAAVANPILWLVDRIAWGIIYVIAIPVGLLIEGISYLLSLLGRRGASAPPPTSSDQAWLADAPQRTALMQIPPEVILAIKWTIVALIALAVIVFVARSVARWTQWGGDEQVEEERASVGDWQLFWAVLRLWLLSLLRRGRADDSASLAPEQRGPITLDDSPPVAASIRQVYRDLLRLASTRGASRPRYATPYEHLPQLQVYVKPEDDVSAVTEAYVLARYGPSELSLAQLEAVQASWARVQAQLHSLESEQPSSPPNDNASLET